MSQKSVRKQQKTTAKQREARIEAARARELRAQEQRERSSRLKRIFTVVVCVILVLALFIPTMALTVFGGN